MLLFKWKPTTWITTSRKAEQSQRQMLVIWVEVTEHPIIREHNFILRANLLILKRIEFPTNQNKTRVGNRENKD